MTSPGQCPSFLIGGEEVRTIPGKIVIKQYDRADDVLPNGDAFHMTCGYPCEYGGFQMPFELKIAKN